LEKAGLARGAIRNALDEAVGAHFIRCLREAQPSLRDKTAISGVYELKWDERSEYIKDPSQFRGFFSGEGNRTYIPNEFFDVVIPSEPLAVLKVVGSIIRLSIGFQNKWDIADGTSLSRTSTFRTTPGSGTARRCPMRCNMP